MSKNAWWQPSNIKRNRSFRRRFISRMTKNQAIYILKPSGAKNNLGIRNVPDHRYNTRCIISMPRPYFPVPPRKKTAVWPRETNIKVQKHINAQTSSWITTSRLIRPGSSADLHRISYSSRLRQGVALQYILYFDLRPRSRWKSKDNHRNSGKSKIKLSFGRTRVTLTFYIEYGYFTS